MQLSDLRKQYPQYDDVPDDKLADGFYNTFYANKMDRDTFNVKVGLVQDKPKGIIGALTSGTERAVSGLGTWKDVLLGDNKGIQESSFESQKIGRTKEQEAFSLAANNPETEGFLDSLGDVATAIWNQPTGALHESVAQTPNMAAVLTGMYAFGKAGAVIGTLAKPGVGTALGAVTGGIIGMFVGNTSIEGGFIAQEKAQKAASEGREFSEADRLETIKQGAIKGGVITAVDALSLGINKWFFGAPGRAVESAVRSTLVNKGIDVADDVAVRAALSSKDVLADVVQAGTKAFDASMTVGKRVGRGAGAMTLETLSEGVGEYTGSLAAGLDASYTDAILEGLLATPMSITEMYVAKKLDNPGKLTQYVQEQSTPDRIIKKGDPNLLYTDEGVGQKADTLAAKQEEVKGIINTIMGADTVDDAITAGQDLLDEAMAPSPAVDSILTSLEIPTEAVPTTIAGEVQNQVEPELTASVPTMITKAMRSQLDDLGYSADDIRQMKPQQAWDAINDGARKRAEARGEQEAPAFQVSPFNEGEDIPALESAGNKLIGTFGNPAGGPVAVDKIMDRESKRLGRDDLIGKTSEDNGINQLFVFEPQAKEPLKLSEINIMEEVVDEQGQKVQITRTADVALEEIDTRADGMKALITCLRG